MEASDVKRKKEPEAENTQRKSMNAESGMQNRAVKNLTKKSFNASGETGSCSRRC
ncbi:hypothetical protein BH11BAC4_BH11BAC4_24360 [soil metagenome]